MRRLLPGAVAGASTTALVVALLIPPTAYSERLVTVLFGAFSLAYVLVGALVAMRRPGNPLGWLMLGIGALSSLTVLSGAYAGHALVTRDDLPFGRATAWVTSWAYQPVLAGIVLIVLVFPGGTVDGGVRRLTARTCVAAGGVLTLSSMLTPGPMDGFGGVRSPFGVEEAAEVLGTVTTVAVLTLAVTFLVALVAIFVRLHGASGVERQQLSWFAYATVLMVLAQGINVPGLGLDDSLVGLLAVVLAIVAFPTAVAIAVLRHRLYDIDRLISRTLVYGALTATLVTTYLLLVLVLQTLLRPVAGDSELAVAGSTLAVAALFRPVRGRIQTGVDRRFYRGRYDAVRTVQNFTGRLRQEVDLDAVSADLRAAVRETVQPAHVSLWLRRDR